MASNGRLVVPAELRRHLGLEGGGTLVARVEGGRIVLEPYSAVVRRVQGYFSRFKDPGRSLVDELIADRRAEAAREDAGERS